MSAISSVSHPKVARDALADAFSLRLEDLPHVIHGSHVRKIEITFHRRLDACRRRTYAAVIQIDEASIHREGLLHLTPEDFIGGNLLRRAGVTGEGFEKAREGGRLQRNSQPEQRRC